MKILSMTATFGKLNRARLTFGDGLNVIHTPNEGGKSTWCAFWKAMLFGIDTRDRDKKGYLAYKTRYQPWSGAPMEGEVLLEWQGRTLILRRGPRGNVPFGAFSATDARSGDPIPDLTAENCGEVLTGVSREVFERSAFLSALTPAITSTPDLERRLTALLTAGQEDVSYSQTRDRLKGWRNRRFSSRSSGLIPQLEEELSQLRQRRDLLLEQSAQIAALEGEMAGLEEEKRTLEGELSLHTRLNQRELNSQYARAREDYERARAQLERLEREGARIGTPPDPLRVREAQGQLQYLKVLKGEIAAARAGLEEAEETYIQAQIAAQDRIFSGLSGDQAAQAVHGLETEGQTLTHRAARAGKWFLPMALLGLLLLGAGLAADLYLYGLPRLFLPVGAAGLLLSLSVGLLRRSKAKNLSARAAALPRRYGFDSMEELAEHLEDYRARCARAQTCADQARDLRLRLNDAMARQENTRTDLFDFVHTFAPEVKDLFGCSAALSRALNLEHELSAARERLDLHTRLLSDLEARGGQPYQTLELLHPPARSEEETRAGLEEVNARLEELGRRLSHAQGARQATGDPALTFAALEQGEEALARRTRELKALETAMEALDRANESLRQRFSPLLNRKTGEYLSLLTRGRYDRVTLDRNLEATAALAGEVLPHSALYLSRGTADQLYLAVRLAVCDLCLDQKPPLMLDDALITFDDTRLDRALHLLRDRGEEQQILLFTCQKREEERLEAMV